MATQYGTLMYLGDRLVDTSFLGSNQILPFFAETGTYVTSGSVLLLDAANSNSYPGSGSIWYDLSGFSNNAALSTQLAATWTGVSGSYFDFPLNAAFTGSVAQQTNLNNAFAGDFTIDMWITVDSLNAVSDWVTPFGKNSQVGISTLINRDTNASNRGQNRLYYNSFAYPPTNKLNIVTGSWFNWQITRSGTSLTYYENTTSLGANTLSGNLSNTNNLILGLGFSGAVYPMDGKMGFFAIYNRALSPIELAKNYNSIKNRYGK